MNKPGHSFNTILSSSSFTSIFLAVESIICIYIYIYKREANLDIILNCGVLTFSPFEILWKENGVLDFCCETDPTVTKGSERMQKPFSEFLSCHNSDQFNTTS